MTQSEKPDNPYKRTSDRLITAQLMGTICAIIFGFLATQWNIGNLIATQAATNAELRTQLSSMKDDVQEVKQTLHEIQRTQSTIQEMRSH